MASLVFGLFAVFVVCALASERAEIPRAEEGICGVVLCLVLRHGLTQIADKDCTSASREERARECAGWREGQAGRGGLRTGLELVYSLQDEAGYPLSDTPAIGDCGTYSRSSRSLTFRSPESLISACASWCF